MESAARECKRKRRAAGLTVAQLAKAVKCTARTIHYLEDGTHEPSYRLMMAITEACSRAILRREQP